MAIFTCGVGWGGSFHFLPESGDGADMAACEGGEMDGWMDGGREGWEVGGEDGEGREGLVR